MKNIVSIGAGTGQANLLKSLMNNGRYKLTGLVSVTDDGGHSGRIRRDLKTFGVKSPQIGDGRNCLLKLARNKEVASLFKVLKNGENSANTLIAGLLSDGRTLTEAFEKFGKLVDAAGTIIPVTNEDVDIIAEYEGDIIVSGEWNIMEYNHTDKLKRLRLSRPVKINPKALTALDNADSLIIGPGSFRTGIISALLPEGMKEKIMDIKAKIIYVCNLFSQPGQTDGITQAGYIEELYKYIGRVPDVVLVNNGSVHDKVIQHYKDSGSSLIKEGDLDSLGCMIVRRSLIPKIDDILRNSPEMQRMGSFKKWTHLLTHERGELARTIIEIIDEA